MPSKKSQKKPPKPAPAPAPKPAKPAPPPREPAAEPFSPAQLGRQQALLDVFADAFDPVLSSPAFHATLREVKQALYNRDFALAFGSAPFLDVYAARWSPTRALGYGEIFGGLRARLEGLAGAAARATSDGGDGDGGDGDEAAGGVELEEEGHHVKGERVLKVLSVGGGAAEIVALGSFLSPSSTTTTSSSSTVIGDLTLLDTGPWGPIVEKLHGSLTTPPPVSRYIVAAAKEPSDALIAGPRLRSNFIKQDVLSLDTEQLGRVVGPDALLVTLLFTLNELYTSGGIGRTTGFLRNLTSCIPPGSLLLVVDSPGSYSEAAVGKEAKKYPMQWLLDHTLLESDKLPLNGCQWEKLESEDSVWFRVAGSLRYPISLENMRYQMHLYRANPRDAPVG